MTKAIRLKIDQCPQDGKAVYDKCRNCEYCLVINKAYDQAYEAFYGYAVCLWDDRRLGHDKKRN